MKTAVITGSNRGIGWAMLQAFAHEGYQVFAVVRELTAEFEERLKKLQETTSGAITPIAFDLRDEAAMTAGVKEIFRQTKTVDVLVNNAGIPHNGMLLMTPLDEIRAVYEVNVFSQLRLIQLIAKKMIRAKTGVIINMCSVGGQVYDKGYIAYGSSKAALIYLTKVIAKELLPYGIRVNGIAPGLTDTKMGHFKNEEQIAAVLGSTINQRFIRPSEIADLAVYLASDKAAMLTGQIITVDGGAIYTRANDC